MKVRLILKEGAGAGDSYPLDPSRQAIFSVGRSTRCDITVHDQRASRHHCDIRWNGSQWEIVDRGSMNSTYVNGVEIDKPYELRPGDRITLGETTMILSQPAIPPAAMARRAHAEAPVTLGDGHEAIFEPLGRPSGSAQGLAKAEIERDDPSGRWGWTAVAFWLVQGTVAAAVLCLATGAFLPWLRVSGSLSQDLGPLLQGIADIVSILSGPDSILNVTQEIGGLEGYGKLTLGVAGVGLFVWIMDITAHRRSAIPGILYLAGAVLASGVVAFDLVNLSRFYGEMKDLSLLFGIRLNDVVEVFDRFIEVQITPVIGLALTGAGLILLIVGGLGRLLVAVLDRGR